MDKQRGIFDDEREISETEYEFLKFTIALFFLIMSKRRSKLEQTRVPVLQTTKRLKNFVAFV